MFAATAPTALTQRSVRANVRSARRTVVCRAGPQETPAAVKTLAAAGVIAAVVASPAYAVVDASTASAEVKLEYEMRYKACGTEECRKVITSVANRKFAKLTGQPAGSTTFSFDGEVTAPAVKAAPAPAPAAPKPAPAPKPTPAPKAEPVEAAKPSAAAATEDKRAAAQKAAAEAKAAEKAAKEKAAAEAKAAAAKAEAKKAEEAAKKKKEAEAAAKKKKEEEERKRKSQGTNPIIYETGFILKGALAAGAVSAPFIYLKKDEVLLNESGEVDPNKFVGKVTETVNNVPNAPVVAAYGAAGAVALSVVDGIVNAPLLNIIIGGPVQILGLLTAVALGLRYVKEGKSWEKDFKNTHAKLNNIVPDDLPRPLPETLAAEWEAK